jgi:hypothetical protein
MNIVVWIVLLAAALAVSLILVTWIVQLIRYLIGGSKRNKD